MDKGKRISEEEFVSLVLRHEHRVRSFVAVVMGRVGESVDDLFQSVCLVGWRKVNEFRYTHEKPDEQFVRWLCTIARFEALQVRRKEQSSKLLFNADLMEQLADSQLSHMEEINDRFSSLSKCIEKLPKLERRILLLRYGQEHTVAAISKVIGRSENGVYKSLERIRMRLLSCVRIMQRQEG